MTTLLKNFSDDPRNLARARRGREAVITAPEGAEAGDAVTRSGYKALVLSVEDGKATVVDLYFPWED